MLADSHGFFYFLYAFPWCSVSFRGEMHLFHHPVIASSARRKPRLNARMRTSRLIPFRLPVSILMAVSVAAPLSGTQTDSLTIAAVGDLMAHDSQIAAAWVPDKNAYDFDPVFFYAQDLLTAADLAVGNLETTLPGAREQYSGYPAFGAPDAFASALKNAGFDLLNTANNHCADKGGRVLGRTLDVLDTLGLLHAGTYRDERERDRNRVLRVSRNGIDLAFLAYTYGLNGARPKQGVVNVTDTARMAEDIGLARAGNPDFIIAMLHFGVEYRQEPDSSQVRLADFLFLEGADVVLGGHPHVLERFERKRLADRTGRIRDRLVAYSLGNFLSNQRKPRTDGGMIFSFTLKRICLPGGDTLRTIGAPRAVPVWVYDSYDESSNRFLILPIEQYLRNYQPFDMPAASLRQMDSFLDDFRIRIQPE
jgi:poly-gamma-glutamate capsule biosynthesis protein CapA/YwtB (metallophosphatase superfamily)